jgi:hypothetical protein
MATEREKRGARGSTRPTRTEAPGLAARGAKKRKLASKADAAAKPTKAPKRVRPSDRGEPSIRPVRWTGAELPSQRPDTWHEDWDVSREELALEDALVLEEPELVDDELPTPDEDADDEAGGESMPEASAARDALGAGSARVRNRGEARLDTPPLADDDDDEDGRGRRRSKTIARKQMMRDQRRLAAAGALPIVDAYDRPRAREACREAERPCLYVACRYHLFLDVNPTTGSIKLNFPDKEVWELEHTCALDIAERGGITLEEVGEIMNLTRERIRQVEASGLEKLREGHAALETFIDGRELGEGAPTSSAPRAKPAPVAKPRGSTASNRPAPASPRIAARPGAAAPKASVFEGSSVTHRSVRPAASPKGGTPPGSTSARPTKRSTRDDD